MTDFIEFDPVDDIAAGAFGQPGQRTFVIQARKGSAVLSVLVEKEQVRLLAVEAQQFLDRIAEEEPEEPPSAVEVDGGAVREDEPLFRARLIGIGYDAERGLVLIELREDAAEEDDEEPPPPPDEAEGRIARLYATRAQIRVMMRNGVTAVEGGRPNCPLCDFPMNPDGHICPRWN
ncbi:MAG: hypothetical protein QOG65_470 [Actinomycetota bacterium]|jgi:uncharacterized repeat protein (TIGR03847 family)|nr:hypothetical protein [Actinomycetota bacterium]MDQ1383091.1 hypothetical protein [Actinomycetota bacterium]